MLRKDFIVTSAAGILLKTFCLAFGQTETKSTVKTGYAPVNGLKLYYEIRGRGVPLILLHGGSGDAGVSISKRVVRRIVGREFTPRS